MVRIQNNNSRHHNAALQRQEPRTDTTQRAVFILAPLPRSGTNYAWDLLRLHPDCSPGRSPLWEDYVVKNVHHLDVFMDALHASWDPVWGPSGHHRPDLSRHLGTALLDFLSVDPHRRLVTKSPTLENLESFFEFFPQSHVVLLLRDGRDVVRSGMKTFGWQLEDAAAAWAAGVDRMLTFAERADIPHTQRSVVRYEDLHRRPRKAMARLLQAVGLPLECYDFAAAASLPIRGSSTFRGGDATPVHWHPVPRTESFQPTNHWNGWTDHDRDTFLSLAARQLRRAGYAD